MIWKITPTVDEINQRCKNSLCEHLGIIFTEIGDRFLKAKMKVDQKTMQPMGILHGGASCALAETIGSVAANLCLEHGKIAVGLDLNINHIRQVREGFVYAKTEPLHIGRTTQVWEIKITNESEQLVAASRLTLSIISPK